MEDVNATHRERVVGLHSLDVAKFKHARNFHHSGQDMVNNVGNGLQSGTQNKKVNRTFCRVILHYIIKSKWHLLGT